jgi:hypothetical protein
LHSWNGAVMYTVDLVKPVPGDEEYRDDA